MNSVPLTVLIDAPLLPEAQVNYNFLSRIANIFQVNNIEVLLDKINISYFSDHDRSHFRAYFIQRFLHHRLWCHQKLPHHALIWHTIHLVSSFSRHNWASAHGTEEIAFLRSSWIHGCRRVIVLCCICEIVFVYLIKKRCKNFQKNRMAQSVISVICNISWFLKSEYEYWTPKLVIWTGSFGIVSVISCSSTLTRQ